MDWGLGFEAISHPLEIFRSNPVGYQLPTFEKIVRCFLGGGHPQGGFLGSLPDGRFWGQVIALKIRDEGQCLPGQFGSFGSREVRSIQCWNQTADILLDSAPSERFLAFVLQSPLGLGIHVGLDGDYLGEQRMNSRPEAQKQPRESPDRITA